MFDFLSFDIELFQMAIVFLTLMVAMYSYARERITIEYTSVIILSFLMVFFYFFPALNDKGDNLLNVSKLLSGFSNPALISVISLMIVGEAISKTGALEFVSTITSKAGKLIPAVGMILALIIVGSFSAFLNNIPMVVVFIPVIVVLARKLKLSASKWLIPLSYITILGGFTTLVGSSTNLLVSGALEEFNEEPFDFFSFTKLGLMLAVIGGIYVLFILPKLLEAKRTKNKDEQVDEQVFFASIKIDKHSPLSGREVLGWIIKDLGVDILTIERAGKISERPFSGKVILPGDTVLLSSTRNNLLSLASAKFENLNSSFKSIEADLQNASSEQVVSEIIISSNSSYIGTTLSRLALHIRSNITPIGIARSTGVGSSKDNINQVPLKAGDVLLVVSLKDSLDDTINNSDFIFLESSIENVRHPHHVLRTLGIFFAVVALSSTNVIPVPIATFLGAVAMIGFGSISFSEAFKVVDSRVVLLITTSLAMGLALKETGGAIAIADNMLYLFEGFPASVILSVFFLIVMTMTNILSNQATAVLFTPIAISLATNLNVDINAFAFAVVFGANCCFVTPIAYQTNLLVMTPGKYNFKDFVKAGLPLAILLWITYSIIAPIYFDF